MKNKSIDRIIFNDREYIILRQYRGIKDGKAIAGWETEQLEPAEYFRRKLKGK